MRIAVLSEVSARDKNAAIVGALRECGQEALNIGMTCGEGGTELTYIHTGFMAGALLNIGAADMVIGGCGTGMGFLNSSMQYPNVFCGLIQEPLDAFLFSQINAGNCISLALNKGYGWAGDLNLRYIFEKLFSSPLGGGYPTHRSDSQALSRKMLEGVSQAAHRDYGEIVKRLDKDIVRTALAHKPFYDQLSKHDFRYFEDFSEEIK